MSYKLWTVRATLLGVCVYVMYFPQKGFPLWTCQDWETASNNFPDTSDVHFECNFYVDIFYKNIKKQSRYH